MPASSVLVLFIIAAMLYVFWKFGYRDERAEPYEEAVNDVESRLDWARSRPTPLPAGMETHLQEAETLVAEAKKLWNGMKWDRALRTAWKARKAMNQAQGIFSADYKARN